MSRATRSLSASAIRATAVAVVGLAAIACGSSRGALTTTVPATTATTQAPTTVGTSPVGTTTTLAGRSTVTAFLPRATLPFVAGAGSLTVTGDFQATARFSASSCSRVSLGEAHGFLAGLLFVSSSGAASMTYALDLVGFSPQVTNLAPTLASGSANYPQGVRLSVSSAGKDYLDWGAYIGGNGFGSGTLTLATPNQKSGSLDVELPFVGDDNGSVPRTARQPVHVAGSWSCT